MFAQVPTQPYSVSLFAPPDNGFPIEAALGICVPALVLLVIGVTLILSINRRKMQRDDMEATLKMEMIERGMTAEDIERVLAARIGPPKYGHNCRHQKRWKPVNETQERAMR